MERVLRREAPRPRQPWRPQAARKSHWLDADERAKAAEGKGSDEHHMSKSSGLAVLATMEGSKRGITPFVSQARNLLMKFVMKICGQSPSVGIFVILFDNFLPLRHSGNDPQSLLLIQGLSSLAAMGSIVVHDNWIP